MSNINAQTIINQVMAAHAIAPDDGTEYITFKTSERGTHRIINDKAHLQRFADAVRKNAAAFGGGLIREAKTAPAVSYASKTISLYKQLIEDKDWYAALQLADEKLAPLFFVGTDGKAYMQVAPIPCEFEPRLVSAMNEDGKWAIVDPVSMIQALGNSRKNLRSRDAQIAEVKSKFDSMTFDKVSAIFAKIATVKQDQSAARAQWMAEHGIVDDAAIDARIEQQAAQDVAEIVAQAVAVSAIAEAMAPAAETESTHELVTCEDGESESNCASIAQFINVAADSVGTLRKIDVSRVIDEAPTQYRQELAAYIQYNRPDLEQEVADVLEEITPTTRPVETVEQPATRPVESTEDAPRIIQQRPSDWPYASSGWSTVGGGRNAPGYASERSAKIDLSKNPEWKERDARIVAFKWNDGGICGCSPYWKTETRYAILVKKMPEVAEVAPIEDTSPVVESAEITAPAPEPVPVVEIEATTPAMESTPEPVSPVVGTSTEWAPAIGEKYIGAVECAVAMANMRGDGMEYRVGQNAIMERRIKPIALQTTKTDDHAKFNIRAKSGAWFACVYMIGTVYGLRFEAKGMEPITGEFATHQERMAALEMMANALNTPPDGGLPIASVDAPTEAPTPPVAECTPGAPVAVSTASDAPLHPRNIVPTNGVHIVDDAFEAWTYQSGARFGFVMYLGKSAKPWKYYGYKSEAARDDGFQRHAAEARDIAAFKAKRKAEDKAKAEQGHGLQVGDVVRSSWGYDQTNVNHYQITKLIGKRTVEVRELVEHKESTGDMTGHVAPVWGEFIGEPMRRTVDRHGHVNILREKFGRASKIEPVAVVHGVRCYASTGYSNYA